jgi:hypothetical protein
MSVSIFMKIIFFISIACLIFGCSMPVIETANKPPAIDWLTEKKFDSINTASTNQFGGSVAADGCFIVIGAPGEKVGGIMGAGAVYIFKRNFLGGWDEGLRITEPNGNSASSFGHSVSISGDYIIVGAQSADGKGAAYVFHGIPGTLLTYNWDAGVKLMAPDGENGDNFGFSVSISGDYCIVGAPYEGDTVNPDRGTAYIYHRTGTNSWNNCKKIFASDYQNGDLFGFSVSISGDYAVAGAPNKDTYEGAAYIFYKTGANIWEQCDKKTAYDGQDYDVFGISVSISGDYIVVGAKDDRIDGICCGSAYVFHKINTAAWDGGVKLIQPGYAKFDRFGFSTGISGNNIIIGAWNKDSGFPGSGAANIFHRTGTNSWSSIRTLTASDKTEGDSFGYAVAIIGDLAIVGAPYKKIDNQNYGRTYVYLK